MTYARMPEAQEGAVLDAKARTYCGVEQNSHARRQDFYLPLPRVFEVASHEPTIRCGKNMCQT